MKRAVVVIVALCVSVACTDPSSPSAQLPQESTPTSTAKTLITIDSLDLSFRLPPSFAVVEGAEFTFLARSTDPRGVFSIEPDAPAVIAHQPEEGESVAPADIDGVEGVIITDAVVDRLPPGVEARELLVANGDRSFTLIMSAEEAELPSLWEQFIRSVAIEPLNPARATTSRSHELATRDEFSGADPRE